MRWALVAVLLLAPAAAALPEGDAASAHPDVVRAWHEPEPVQPGSQWSGFLQLRPGHGAANVSYQVCDVADGVCFSFPHPAADVGNGTFRFDTADYLANGRPVRWEAGWRVGVRWFLAGPDGNGTWVPRAPPSPTEVVPIEDLYLTFDIPGGGARGSPAPGLVIAALAIAAAALRRRA